MFLLSRIAVTALSLTLVASAPNARRASKVNKIKCNDESYTYKELAGYGLVPSNARDKFGDNLGGLGSSIALEEQSWQILKNGSYTGTIWVLPDRGWYDEIAPFSLSQLTVLGTPRAP